MTTDFVGDRLSIIIPVFNAEATLERAVQSLRQMKIDYEIILIENGSSDNSIGVCEALCEQDDRIRLVQCNKKGASAARNAGLEVATGEYIGFLDADDYVDAEKYELMFRNISQGDSDLAVAGYYMEYPNGKRIRVDIEPTLTIDDIRQKLLGKENPQEAPYMGSIWRCIYKREIFNKYSIRFDEALEIGEDTFINLEYIKYAKNLKIFPDVPYIYSQNETSLSNRFDSKMWDKYRNYFAALYEYLVREGGNADRYRRVFYKINELSTWIVSECISSQMSMKKKRQYLDAISRDINNYRDNFQGFVIESKYLYAVSKGHYLWLLAKGEISSLKVFVKRLFRII